MPVETVILIPFTRPVVQGRLVLAGGVCVPSLSQCWRHVAIDERAVLYAVLRGWCRVVQGGQAHSHWRVCSTWAGGSQKQRAAGSLEQRYGVCGVCELSCGVAEGLAWGGGSLKGAKDWRETEGS